MNELFKRVLILLSLFCFFALVKPFVTAINRVNTVTQDSYIVNIGYIGSYLSGTLGIVLTAGSLIFLARTLSFERKKSDQENLDNKFFLMLERLENIKDKINEDVKNKILNEIDRVDEFSVKKTLEKSKVVIHKYNSEVGHYYRMLFQILKMIDQNENKIYNFDNVNILYYTNILRATLDYKLTQILAINIYYSEDFDFEYENYSYYVQKYNLLEHMPFSVSENRISQSLLAVYLNSNKGFGNSSFVKKINKCVVNYLKASMLCKYDYDLRYSFLKRFVGVWEVGEIILKISIQEKLIQCEINGKKWVGMLINIYPETDRLIKCSLYNDDDYNVFSHFDEDLNFNLIFDESAYIEPGTSKDSRRIKLKFVVDGIEGLMVEYVNESIVYSDYDFFEPLTKAVKMN